MITVTKFFSKMMVNWSLQMLIISKSTTMEAWYIHSSKFLIECNNWRNKLLRIVLSLLHILVIVEDLIILVTNLKVSINFWLKMLILMIHIVFGIISSMEWILISVTNQIKNYFWMQWKRFLRTWWLWLYKIYVCHLRR